MATEIAQQAPPDRNSGVDTREAAPSVEDCESQISSLAASSQRMSYVRLFTFIGFVLGLFGSAVGFPRLVPALVSLPSLLAYFVAFYRHGCIRDDMDRLENLLLLLRESLERKSTRRRARPLPPPARDTQSGLERGLRIYASEPQSFELNAGVAGDLELLSGPRSLFGFLDVSSTVFGARRLQHMITHPLTSADDIRARQRSVVELASSDATRRELLEALVALRHCRFERIPEFLHAPTTFAGRTGLLIVANVLGTAGALLLVATMFSFELFLPWLFLVALFNLGLIGFFVKSSNPARDRLIAFGPLLRGLLDLEDVLRKGSLENSNWKEISELLTALQPVLVRLGRWIGLLELHSYGIIFEIVNVLTLWELRFLPAAEKLFHEHRFLLEKSLGTLGETEALLSLACPLSEQPGFTLPEPLEAPRPSIEAEAMGHPLIENDVLVRNTVSLAADDNVVIVTGSNMAGKSTYLKSLGSNVVLAAMGGPVCAQSFRWTPLEIFSDINVRDSLDDGKSYFQVEVERVLEVVEASRSPKVLAIFDELFRGTNSEERLQISRALLTYLRTHGILLVVATHDSALTRLVTEDDEKGMRNFHFREEVQGKTMTFDYKLREGPAPTRNAIRVLEASGYPPEIIRDARGE